MSRAAFFLLLLILASCEQQRQYDLIIRGGMLYDGSGNAPMISDIAIQADTIAFIGDLGDGSARKEIDATGLAVAPGFINMLSWATETLVVDGNGESDIRQGVTLEIFGEGVSMGPLNDAMKAEMQKDVDRDAELRFDIEWTTLAEYLQFLEDQGVSPNVASFIGATTLRLHEVGAENRAPRADELDRMKDLVRMAMEEGALGVGASLIYPPATFSTTDELIELSRIAGQYGGMYIVHMRSEGNAIMDAINETITIAREASVPAEIYHLKLAGQNNWNKLDAVLEKIDRANRSGIKITADMYTYTAGATGLDASMPPWIQEGGLFSWIKKMKDPALRERALKEMRRPTAQWENLLLMAGSADRVLLLSFANDSLKRFTGKTLADVARIHGKSPEETAMDLVISDSTRVGAAYFMMSEENVRRQIALPYMSFGSDAAAPAADGAFLKYNPHPRAYGNFARLLGKYVRDEKLIPLEEAVRRLTSLPAQNLKLKKRGTLQVGYFADIVVFDPQQIEDHATFENPHQYSTGVIHVIVNGTPVLANGEHTGARPGRFLKGPGYKNQLP